MAPPGFEPVTVNSFIAPHTQIVTYTGFHSALNNCVLNTVHFAISARQSTIWIKWLFQFDKKQLNFDHRLWKWNLLLFILVTVVSKKFFSWLYFILNRSLTCTHTISEDSLVLPFDFSFRQNNFLHVFNYQCSWIFHNLYTNLRPARQTLWWQQSGRLCPMYFMVQAQWRLETLNLF